MRKPTTRPREKGKRRTVSQAELPAGETDVRARIADLQGSKQVGFLSQSPVLQPTWVLVLWVPGK